RSIGVGNVDVCIRSSLREAAGIYKRANVDAENSRKRGLGIGGRQNEVASVAASRGARACRATVAAESTGGGVGERVIAGACVTDGELRYASIEIHRGQVATRH